MDCSFATMRLPPVALPGPLARLKRCSHVSFKSDHSPAAQYERSAQPGNRNVSGYGRRIRLIAAVAASVTD